MSLAEAIPGRLLTDGDNFEPLYRSYFPRLVRYLRRRTGDQAHAEDLAQETLLRAYVNLSGIDVNRPLWPWLKTIATRLVIDEARCSGREVLGDPEIPAGSETYDLDLFNDDLIHKALERLTRNQKVAVSLRYLDDWTSAEAATFLGINRIAFEQLLLRARRRFRREYARLSDCAPAILVLSYRRVRKLFLQINERVRALGPSTASAGTIGFDAAAQLASGVLVFLTVAASVASALPTQGSLSLPTHETRPIVAAGPLQEHVDGGSRTEPAGAAGSSTSGPSAAAVFAGDHGADRVVKKVADPNDGVKDPEDARITSIAFGPGSGEDQTVYATGRTDCSNRCPKVLFASTDGGATWNRLRAEGLEGDSLIVPPGGDGRILFAMGSSGLQVSRDRGQTFTFAAPAGATFTVGSAAVSPGFYEGDPSVLIGAQTLVRYRDDTTTLEPHPAPLVGPLNPVYAPGYPSDPRIFVGGVKVEPLTNETVATIHTCNGAVCTGVTLPEASFSPKVRVANSFEESGILFGFVRNLLFGSQDFGRTFAPIRVPLGTWALKDVAYSQTGEILAATKGRGAMEGGGLLLSPDLGESWQRLKSPLFEAGVTSIADSSTRMMAALSGGGLACSDDGGRTWAPRCLRTTQRG
jgi:RNA polymerase sigma-70 factor (ECF subfamily)